MIRLKSLLAEISLDTVQPYATRIAWTRYSAEDSPPSYEVKIACDGIQVTFTMESTGGEVTGGEEYSFAFFMPSNTGEQGGLTVSHDRSAAAGALSYLRLMRTAGEAVLDFCTQHAPDAVDVTGGDSSERKEQQKTRIYLALMQANAARLATAGYRVQQFGDHIYLVRSSRADSTGVR